MNTKNKQITTIIFGLPVGILALAMIATSVPMFISGSIYWMLFAPIYYAIARIYYLNNCKHIIKLGPKHAPHQSSEHSTKGSDDVS